MLNSVGSCWIPLKMRLPVSTEPVSRRPSIVHQNRLPSCRAPQGFQLAWLARSSLVTNNLLENQSGSFVRTASGKSGFHQYTPTCRDFRFSSIDIMYNPTLHMLWSSRCYAHTIERSTGMSRSVRHPFDWLPELTYRTHRSTWKINNAPPEPTCQ
jgi:hypothetical protein